VIDQAMQVLRYAEYGCYLLTVAKGDEINGMPLSLFTQVSFEPPQVLAAVSRARYAHHMVQDAKVFAVVFLRKDQKGLVDQFKLKGEDHAKKFSGLEWESAPLGSPVLKDCLGYLECELVHTYDPGDHTLFIGEVKKAELRKPGPLLCISDLGKYYAG
jgi:flavin reductase (DIM6/NTAB) family NADH-FMN oxidoreductase RutF